MCFVVKEEGGGKSGGFVCRIDLNGMEADNNFSLLCGFGPIVV